MTTKNGSGASRGAAGSRSGSRRERARRWPWFGVFCLVALVMMVMQPDVIRVRCPLLELEAARGPGVDVTELGVRRAVHGGPSTPPSTGSP